MIPSELRICAELNGGGLSGEHIQLCAEGARRKPNLSGKRTEMHICYAFNRQSLWIGCFLFIIFRKKDI